MPRIQQSELQIKDMETGQCFRVRAADNWATISTRDGESVKIYPYIIKTMVKLGQYFDGTTRIGKRKMLRIT